MRAPYAWAEPPTEHREGSEVDLCVAVGVGVVLLEFQVALVVQESVENERGVAVGALDRGAVERRVVVCDKGVELKREVAKLGAVGLLEHLARQRKPLSVAGRGLAFTPVH